MADSILSYATTGRTTLIRTDRTCGSASQNEGVRGCGIEKPTFGAVGRRPVVPFQLTGLTKLGHYSCTSNLLSRQFPKIWVINSVILTLSNMGGVVSRYALYKQERLIFDCDTEAAGSRSRQLHAFAD